MLFYCQQIWRRSAFRSTFKLENIWHQIEHGRLARNPPSPKYELSCQVRSCRANLDFHVEYAIQRTLAGGLSINTNIFLFHRVCKPLWIQVEMQRWEADFLVRPRTHLFCYQISTACFSLRFYRIHKACLLLLTASLEFQTHKFRSGSNRLASLLCREKHSVKSIRNAQ